MKIYYRIALGILVILGAVILFKLLIGKSVVALLDPKGAVAMAQRNLMIHMVLIMLVVVVPLLITFFIFAWKYRTGNKDLNYDPERPHNVWSEIGLWVIPAVIVGVLWVLTWNSAHALDPYAPINSSVQPITIEVVALPWKWLFIYPEQNIATVNFIEFPVNTPVHFELTADAPMSSFWIPQLGSQIYTMAAMETQLNLIANTTGDFVGKDTEINGAGYSGMKFIAKSVSETDYQNWLQQTKAASSTASTTLDLAAYNALALPSENDPPAAYSSVEGDLFDDIMMKFMTPSSPSEMSTTSSDQSMQGMDMSGMHM